MEKDVEKRDSQGMKDKIVEKGNKQDTNDEEQAKDTGAQEVTKQPAKLVVEQQQKTRRCTRFLGQNIKILEKAEELTKEEKSGRYKLKQ